MNNRHLPKIYAASLYASSQELKGVKLEAVVAEFINLLESRHHQHMIPAVLKELQAIYFQAEGIVATKVISKEPLDTAILSKLKKIISKKSGKQVAIVSEQDENLLGGLIVKYDDKIMDLSIDNQLKKLSYQLKN